MSTLVFRRMVLLLLLVAMALPASAQIPIADARALPLGSTVTVEGSVTVPSATFASFLFDQGFAIQDGSGGIYVRVFDDLHLERHRVVRTTGTLIEEFGLLILVASDVEILQEVALVGAQDFATGAISDATEGLLVRVEGEITIIRDDQPFGFSIFVDDGSGETQVFIPVTPAFHPLQWGWVEVGNTIRATGFSGQFASQFEVNPRSPGDVQFVP